MVKVVYLIDLILSQARFMHFKVCLYKYLEREIEELVRYILYKELEMIF